jgi:hypothetical protein
MLEKQILKDQQGAPMGIFIPIQTWKRIIIQYPEMDILDDNIPQWEKDIIDQRLEIVNNYPERLKPIEALLETL